MPRSTVVLTREPVDAAAVGRAAASVHDQVAGADAAPFELRPVDGGAVLQVVATATLAAYVGSGGLGAPLFLGLRTYDYPLLLAASLVVIVLAITLEVAFALVQRLLRRALRGTS